MKRVAIAGVLLFLLLLGCAGGYHTVRNVIAESLENVNSAQSALERADTTSAADHLQRSYEQWSGHRTLLGALINHTALDKIDALYLRTIQYAALDEPTHALPALSELAAALEQLVDAERLTIENVL